MAGVRHGAVSCGHAPTLYRSIKAAERVMDSSAWRRVVAQLRGEGPTTDVPVDRVYGDANEGVFRVRVDGQDYALKLAAPDAISRETMAHECDAARAGAALGLAPEVLFAMPDVGVLVTRFVAGAALTAETLRSPTTLVRVAGALRTLHASADIAGTQDLPGDLAYELSTAEAQFEAPLRATLSAIVPQIWNALAHNAVPPRPCHNDVHAGNLFDDGGRIALIDWAAAAMGDPAWDLAMLGSSARFDDDDRSKLLAAYGDGPAFEARSRLLGVVADVYNLAWYVNYSGFDAAAAPQYKARLADLCASGRIETWCAALA